MHTKSGIVHLLSDARGIYIPRDFVESFSIECKEEDKESAKAGKAWQGISAQSVIDCQDPDNEWYWDSWIDILDRAYWLDENGNKWSLLQDGDLWAYCFDLMTDEEKQNFGFND